MKKTLRIVSMILVFALLAAALPVSAFAAAKKYVSDVMTFTAESYDEAREGLAKLGYTIVGDKKENADLNATLKIGVYLGYKTTTDPKEALTDLAVMNMNGDFSEADYKALLEEFRENIDRHISDQLPAIANFQNNYKNGRPSAVNTYKSLNNFIDDRKDGSGQRMGDFLLGYDFSDKSKAILTETFMQGNQEIVTTIETLLTLSSETENTTFIDRMLEKDYDTIEEEYMDEYGSYELALLEMSRRFDEPAATVLKDWEAFRLFLETTVKKYETTLPDGSTGFNEAAAENDCVGYVDAADGLTEEQVKDYNSIVDLVNTLTKGQAAADYALCGQLASIEYDGGTLFDFFTRSVSDVELYELYPLLNALNDAQRGQMKLLGLKTLLVAALSDEQQLEDASAVEPVELPEPTSVYSGVDLSIYDDGVALTGAAQQYEERSGENWLASVISDTAAEGDYYTGMLVASSVFVGTVVFGLAANATISSLSPGLSGYVRELMKSGTPAARAEIRQIASRRGSGVGLALRFEKIRKFVNYGAFALLLIALIVDAYFIWQFINSKQAAESEIPHHLVAASDTQSGTRYICYAAVKDQNGKAADLNAHAGDRNIGWLTLYAAKDSSAGSPIEADSLRVTHGTAGVPKDSSSVHLFGSNEAVNVTAKSFTGYKDTVGGTKIYFTRDVNAFTASAFSDSVLLLAAGGGLVVGVLLGLLSGTLLKRKKKAAKA